MSPQLIEELRSLRSRSNDPEDCAVLTVMIRSGEAQGEAEQLAEEMTDCLICPETWPVSLLNEEGECPNCVNEARQRLSARRRADVLGF